MKWGGKKTRQAFKCHRKNKVFNVINGCIGFMRMPHIIILGMPLCPTLSLHSLEKKKGLGKLESYKGLIQMHKSRWESNFKVWALYWRTKDRAVSISIQIHCSKTPTSLDYRGRRLYHGLGEWKRYSRTWKTFAVSLRTNPHTLQVALSSIKRPVFGIWKTWIRTLALCLPCWLDLGKEDIFWVSFLCISYE